MILITGASGFVGKKLMPLIKKQYPNEDVFLCNETENNLVTGRGLGKLPHAPRLIFHLAAATDTSKRDQKCNNIGTKNLLSALPGIGPQTHFIFTSSQAIFSGRRDTKKPITEKTQPSPNNNYGKTKLEAEKILLNAARKKKFKLTIIRFPTVWGNNPRKNSFLNFLKKLVDNNSLFSRLNWPGKIALVNVNDAASFVVMSSQKRSKAPLVTFIAVENLTLAEILEKITNSKGKKYRQIKIPNFIWKLARSLTPYLKYFEKVLPPAIYNYFWRASIIVDSPLMCKINLKGTKFTS